MTSQIPASNSKPQFSPHPMLWLGVCFAAGIAAQNLLDLNAAVLLAVTLAAASLVLVRRAPAAVCLCIAFGAAGGAALELGELSSGKDRLREMYDAGRLSSSEPVEIEGRITRLEPAYDGYIIDLEAESIDAGDETAVTGRLRLYLPIRSTEAAGDLEALGLRAGSRIRTLCAPEREERFLNPGVMPRIERLDQQDIDAAATIKSPLLIEKIGDEFHFGSAVLSLRQHLIEQFRSKLSPSTAGIMIASLLGDKYYLDRDTAEVFREGGTFHVLVISGLHITFIGGLTLLLVRRVTRNRLVQFLGPTIFLWAYTFAVGAEVPVVRASVMFTLLLFASAVYRKGSLVNTLGLCAVVLLAWRPHDLFTASFQLTFVSVGAIVGFVFPLIEKMRSIGAWTPGTGTPFPPSVSPALKRLCEMLYWREDAWRIESAGNIWSASLFKSPYLKALGAGGLQSAAAYLAEAALLSLAVQIFMLPLTIVYFHRVSPSAVFLNIWVGFFIAIESILAAAAVLIAAASETLASPIFWMAEVSNTLLLSLPSYVADAGLASFRVPVYPGWMKVVYFVYLIPAIILAAAIYRWEPFAVLGKRRRSAAGLSALLTVVLAGVLMFHPYSTPAADGRLTVHFLDVGQGDAAFIKFPNGETMLIDGGGQMNFASGESGFVPDTPRVGEAVVSEFIWEQGYAHIDHVIATHADADHMQGLADVAKNFSIGNVYLADEPAGDPEFDELAAALSGGGAKIHIVRRGAELAIGGVKIEFLNPPADRLAESENDASLATRIVFGEREFLMTGDIEKSAEADMLASGVPVAADVVKVPHHGSRTSSTQPFVDAVQAGYAVVPVGRRSMYGHPHREVVERWAGAGANVLVTGHTGTITFSTDGQGLWMSTFAGAGN